MNGATVPSENSSSHTSESSAPKDPPQPHHKTINAATKTTSLADFASSLKPTNNSVASSTSVLLDRPEPRDVIDGHVVSNLSNTLDTAKVCIPHSKQFLRRSLSNSSYLATILRVGQVLLVQVDSRLVRIRLHTKPLRQSKHYITLSTNRYPTE